MKPSEALTALSMLSSMVTEMEVRWRSTRVVEDSIRAALDAGKIDLIEAGQRAADIIVAMPSIMIRLISQRPS